MIALSAATACGTDEADAVSGDTTDEEDAASTDDDDTGEFGDDDTSDDDIPSDPMESDPGTDDGAPGDGNPDEPGDDDASVSDDVAADDDSGVSDAEPLSVGAPGEAPDWGDLGTPAELIEEHYTELTVVTSARVAVTGVLGLPENPRVTEEGMIRFLTEDPPRLVTLDPLTGDVVTEIVDCEATFTSRDRLASSDGFTYVAQATALGEDCVLGAVCQGTKLSAYDGTGQIWTAEIGAAPDFAASPTILIAHEGLPYVFGAALHATEDLPTSTLFVSKHDDTGASSWLTEVDGAGFGSFTEAAVTSEGTSYLLYNGRLCEIAVDGTQRWCTESEGEFTSLVARGQRLLLVAGRTIVAYDPKTNEVVWTRQFAGAPDPDMSTPVERLTEPLLWSSVSTFRLAATGSALLAFGELYQGYKVPPTNGGSALTPFVARLTDDGSLLWLRAIELDSRQEPLADGSVVPAHESPATANNFVLKDVALVGSTVAVVGTADAGLVSFTLDAADGHLVQAPSRTSTNTTGTGECQ